MMIKKNIPFDAYISQESELTVKYKTKKTLDVEIDGNILKQGLRRLEFKNIEKKMEILKKL